MPYFLCFHHFENFSKFWILTNTTDNSLKSRNVDASNSNDILKKLISLLFLPDAMLEIWLACHSMTLIQDTTLFENVNIDLVKISFNLKSYPSILGNNCQLITMKSTDKLWKEILLCSVW